MRLFDSHAHLTDERFADDLDAVLQRALAARVESIVCIASDLDDAARAVELTRRAARPRLGCTAGLHPHLAERWKPEDAERLEVLAARDRVVAIGETGLDFHYDNAPRQVQIEAFRAQLELAERLGLPVVVHSRAADAETAALIRGFETRVTGVLHCFSGGERLLRAGLDAGWYVSFSGIMTFSKFDDDELVRAVPHDRVLVETDSPYLAPVPVRGRRNEPSFVEHVLQRLAEIRGTSVEEMAEITYINACRFYAIEEVN